MGFICTPWSGASWTQDAGAGGVRLAVAESAWRAAVPTHAGWCVPVSEWECRPCSPSPLPACWALIGQTLSASPALGPQRRALAQALFRRCTGGWAVCVGCASIKNSNLLFKVMNPFTLQRWLFAFQNNISDLGWDLDGILCVKRS